MSTAELKVDLINKITSLTDSDILQDLLQFLQFQTDESIYLTTEEEKKAIAESRNQIAAGEVITNEELQKEFQEWLTK